MNRPKSLILYGGSGEIRTRDQRIKRSRWSSKTYIPIGLAVIKNQCAIDCAIAFWCKVRICGSELARVLMRNS